MRNKVAESESSSIDPRKCIRIQERGSENIRERERGIEKEKNVQKLHLFARRKKKKKWWVYERKTQHMQAHGIHGPPPQTLGDALQIILILDLHSIN